VYTVCCGGVLLVGLVSNTASLLLLGTLRHLGMTVSSVAHALVVVISLPSRISKAFS
jgi:hypothetical protein